MRHGRHGLIDHIFRRLRRALREREQLVDRQSHGDVRMHTAQRHRRIFRLPRRALREREPGAARLGMNAMKRGDMRAGACAASSGSETAACTGERCVLRRPLSAAADSRIAFVS
jgi:hypothetical protein